MPKYILGAIHSKPGIQRDNTFYYSNAHIDGQWVRWYGGNPKKIGGYISSMVGDSLIVRDMIEIDTTVTNPSPPPIDLAAIQLYMGRAIVNTGSGQNRISYITLDYNAAQVSGTSEVDRTPYTNPFWSTQIGTDPEILYDFTTFPQDPPAAAAASSPPVGNYIVVQVAPNATNVAQTGEGYVFYGILSTTDPLSQIYVDWPINTEPLIIDGGLAYDNSQNRLVGYGSTIEASSGDSGGGAIYWTQVGDLSNWTTSTDPLTPGSINFTIIAQQKVVKVFPARGGLLAWTLGELLSVQWVPPYLQPISDTDTIFIQGAYAASPIQNITLMSADCIVSYDQTFFWIGTNQFYYYNGIVQQLKNTMNTDYFFNNVSLGSRAKIYSFAIEKTSEIWWLWPKNNPDGSESPENTNYLVYNVKGDFWFDGELSRSCALSVSTYPRPIMASSSPETIQSYAGPIDVYPVWTHEYQVDKVLNGKSLAIQSYYQTHLIDLWTQQPTDTRWMRIRRVAYDFVQNGDLKLYINTWEYPSSPVIANGPYTIYPKETPGMLPFIDIGNQPVNTEAASPQGSIVSFRFESNVLGGFYFAGKNLFFYNEGDTLK